MLTTGTALLSLSLLTACLPTHFTSLVAITANNEFPIIRTLGTIDPETNTASTSIEEVSVVASGNCFSITQTSFVVLSAGGVIFSNREDKDQPIAASCWTHEGKYVLAKGGRHHMLQGCAAGQPSVKWESPSWLQPNDLTSSNDGKRWYISGQNYSAGMGDLHSVGAGGKKVPTKVGGLNIGRMKGLELSPDNKRILITGTTNKLEKKKVTENGKEVKKEVAVVSAAEICAFPLDKNGVPIVEGEEQIFNIYDNIEGSKAAQVDPDGMRVYVKGNVYATLNVFGKILIFTLTNPYGTKEVIPLLSLKFPTNLKMRGSDWKTLVVVGKCKEEFVDEGLPAWVNQMQVPYPGRQWSALNGAQVSSR